MNKRSGSSTTTPPEHKVYAIKNKFQGTSSLSASFQTVSVPHQVIVSYMAWGEWTAWV